MSLKIKEGSLVSMNKKSISILIVVFMVFSVYGVLYNASFNSTSDVTYGDMRISANNIWTSAKSPYRIEGNITIDPGVNLTIEPGVEVFFNGGYNLYVEGTLYAVGEQSNMIKFTTNISMGDFKDEDRFNIQINSTGNTVLKYSNISYALYGINVSESSQNDIQHNLFTDNFGAILLEKSSNNTISYNRIIGIGETGILLRESNDNLIKENEISGHIKGINLWRSDNNTILSNNVFDNYIQGILLYLSNENNIKYNHIFDNGGNGIDIDESDFNVIFSNNISQNGIVNNDYGVKLDWNSQFNTIYHNTFIDNDNQTYDGTNMSNFWDSGYPQGGNYYSDYSGPDVKRGANQDIPGSDGLGDIPYIIDSDSYDFYPLLTPMRNIAPFLIALISPANGSVINPGTIIDLDILAQPSDTVNYSLNGGNITFTYPFDITADPANFTEGENRLDVYVVDASMNVNSSWFRFVFDSLAPEISLISPLNNSIIPAGEIINISIIEPNLNFVTYSVNNASIFYLLYPYVIDTTGWPDDNYTIEIYAEELSGTNSSEFYNFTLDSTAPLIVMDSPGNNSYVQPGTPLVFSIIDEHTHTVSYTINGGPPQTFDTDYIIDIGSLDDGEYTIIVLANDSIGNAMTSIFGIIVDSITPQIILNGPANNSLIRNGIPINFSIIDENPVLAKYSFDMVNDRSLPPPYLLNTTNFGDGIYKIFLNVTDYAGNQNISWFNFSVDSSEPIVNLLGLNNDSYIQPGLDIVFEIIEMNLAYAIYSVNGGGEESLSDTYTIDTSNWPDEIYTIELSVMDLVGNFVQKTFVFKIDSTSPEIVSTDPKNNDDGVPVDKSIRITFSEPMDDNSLLNALSVTPQINFTPRMTLDNLTLVLTLESDLTNLTEYTVTINSSAKDKAGNHLAEDYTFSFTTGPKEDNSMFLILVLILIMIVIILLVILLRKRKKDKPQSKDEKDEFALKEDSEQTEDKDELIQKGLGEEEEALEDDEIDLAEEDIEDEI